MNSDDKLRVFAECVRLAPTDAASEKIVREMLEGIAKTCPMEVLVQLGRCLVECRRSELQAKARRN